MGFAVWVDLKERIAWAQGTHEYRPMGSAAVALSDSFRERDFSWSRRPPSRFDGSYIGLFGSLVDVNSFLQRRRRGGKPRRPDRLTQYI